MKKKIINASQALFGQIMQYKWLIIKMGLVTYLFIGFAFLYSKPQYVRLVNMGSRSSDVSWVSEKRAKGCMVAIETAKILKSRFGCESGDRHLHLISIKDLQPQTTYKLLYFHGLRLKYFPNIRFITNPEIEDMPPFPNPAYGTVLNQDNQPVADALVIITPQANDGGYPVATRTNIDGNYAIDYGLINRQSQQVSLEAIGTGLIWNEKSINSKVYSPIPFIRVITKE